ncbi:MAG: hypothetical protein WBB76_00265 [Gaiellaceae bacterium]
MPKEIPEFERDDELVEWFESNDLSEYQLDEVLGWSVAGHVSLAIEEPWEAEHSSGSGGATATIELDDSLLLRA